MFSHSNRPTNKESYDAASIKADIKTLTAKQGKLSAIPLGFDLTFRMNFRITKASLRASLSRW